MAQQKDVFLAPVPENRVCAACGGPHLIRAPRWEKRSVAAASGSCCV